MMRDKGIQYQQYEVINVRPLIIKFHVKDENITLMLYMIPQVVEIEDNKVVSVVSTPALSVFSDKPKMGELCSPQKLNSRTPVIPEYEIASEGTTEIKVNDKKVKIRAKITNINVYPDLRDSFGNPCVNVSWIQLIDVE